MALERRNGRSSKKVRLIARLGGGVRVLSRQPYKGTKMDANEIISFEITELVSSKEENPSNRSVES